MIRERVKRFSLATNAERERGDHARTRAKAFSSELDTVSCGENASKQASKSWVSDDTNSGIFIRFEQPKKHHSRQKTVDAQDSKHPDGAIALQYGSSLFNCRKVDIRWL